jgi:hypothetical protein
MAILEFENNRDQSGENKDKECRRARLRNIPK